MACFGKVVANTHIQSRCENIAKAVVAGREKFETKEMQMKRVLLVHPDDNVANAIEDIAKGEEFAYEINGKNVPLQALDEIPFGFKAAVKDIAAGGEVLKYCQVIGVASRAVKAGECVHVHNVEGARGRGDQGGKQ